MFAYVIKIHRRQIQTEEIEIKPGMTQNFDQDENAKAERINGILKAHIKKNFKL